jgi:hypothetical protein
MTGSTPLVQNEILIKFVELTMKEKDFCKKPDYFLDKNGNCYKKKSLKQLTNINEKRYYKYVGCYITTRRDHTTFIKYVYDLITKPICISISNGKYLYIDNNAATKTVLYEEDINYFKLAIKNVDNDDILVPLSNENRVSFMNEDGFPIVNENNSSSASYFILNYFSYEKNSYNFYGTLDFLTNFANYFVVLLILSLIVIIPGITYILK